MPQAIVLLSGGLDSYTAAAIAKREGFELSALSVNYGQRHARELEAARAVAASLEVRRHVEIALDLTRFGGSALTSDIEVPKDRRLDQQDIPVTYVPARNTIFLSLALGWAEVLSAAHRHRRQRAGLLGLSGLPAGVHSCLRAVGGPGNPRRRRGTRHFRGGATHRP